MDMGPYCGPISFSYSFTFFGNYNQKVYSKSALDCQPHNPFPNDTWFWLNSHYIVGIILLGITWFLPLADVANSTHYCQKQKWQHHMSNSKDYYQILGITPSADLAVIKAVYKALALKYHPDRNKSDPAAAVKKMAEINEAYVVLSDEQKRAAYDWSRRGSSEQDQFDDSADNNGNQFDDLENQIEADWSIARKYHGDLDVITSSIAKIAPSLVVPYKITLLEKQEFDNRRKIAENMIDAYIELYFGKNLTIKQFARYLITNNHKDAARELNKAIRVLGSKANAFSIIDQISNEFKIVNSPFGGNSVNENSHNPYGGASDSTNLYWFVVSMVVSFLFVIVVAAAAVIGE